MTKGHLTLLPADADPNPRNRIAAYGMPPRFETDYPLQLQVGRPTLVNILEDNLAAITKNLPAMPKETQPEMEAYRGQLESFLAWVNKYPDMNVWCALAPEPLAPEA